MTIAIVLVVVVVVCVVAAVASQRSQHPENIETELPHRTTATDPLHSGDERPAGPDAEDPPTATPNRSDDPI
ncbi:MAG TPA: hypothetical protein VNS19_13820 [Acidimicrobiales bacterium]|nr:hypothetical protein [Acidimicrobiales bacterium]